MTFNPVRLEIPLSVAITQHMQDVAILVWSEPGPILSTLIKAFNASRTDLQHSVLLVDASGDEDAQNYLVPADELLRLATWSPKMTDLLMCKILGAIPRHLAPASWDLLARRYVYTSISPTRNIEPGKDLIWSGDVHVLGGVYDLMDGTKLQLVAFGDEKYRLHFIDMATGLSKTYSWEGATEPWNLTDILKKPAVTLRAGNILRMSNGEEEVLPMKEDPKTFDFFATATIHEAA